MLVQCRRSRHLLGAAAVLLLCFACAPSETPANPTPTPQAQRTSSPEQEPADALTVRRQDAALRVCDALENTLLVGEPAFLLGALQFAQEEGIRKSELLEAMDRECPGPLRVLHYEPDLMAEFEKLP